MATLATWFRRADFMTVETTTELEAATPNQLRSLPADNIYFYSKRIDNSRLVRQADPKTRADCWSMISTACVLAVVVGTAVSPRIGGILTGYQMEKARTENRELTGRRRALETEQALLLSPQRLDTLAVERKLESPAPGQETLLQPKDTSLSMNVAPSPRSISE